MSLRNSTARLSEWRNYAKKKKKKKKKNISRGQQINSVDIFYAKNNQSMKIMVVRY